MRYRHNLTMLSWTSIVQLRVAHVYREYERHGSNALPLPTELDFSVLTEDEKEIIEEVYDVYGQFSAWRLRTMAYQEPPWCNTETCETISHACLVEYFKTQLLD